MIEINHELTPSDLLPRLNRFWSVSARCIDAIAASQQPGAAVPVFTRSGQYTTRGWTDWTQGFQHGSALLQYDATGEEHYLELGRKGTLTVMAPHLTHIGVHDHGFNNVSTYGNLWRLMGEGRIPPDPWEQRYYELALKVSGAVQAARWSRTRDGTGYIYSFNGPHSLFVDAMRSLRSLALAHLLQHVLHGEHDERITLLPRLVEHGLNTARHNIWYGASRDAYDVRGRTAHESIFHPHTGEYRCPSTQQGYSPFSTWTRGVAWAMLGFAEQLEWLATRTDDELALCGGRDRIEATFMQAARATSDFYIQFTPTCGIPYWDTGAPGLSHLGDYLNQPADPFNHHEPVDSSAATIACQGLMRLGKYLEQREPEAVARRYFQAGLTVLATLLDEPYLSSDASHQGLILHSVYHRPNQWDYVPAGRSVPGGESCMWGDYHAREAAVYVGRMAHVQPYYTFFGRLQR
jgi:hypothetical protein